jgi:hypothetical protein
MSSSKIKKEIEKKKKKLANAKSKEIKIHA